MSLPTRFKFLTVELFFTLIGFPHGEDMPGLAAWRPTDDDHAPAQMADCDHA
jgi:hypothetical protein